MHSKSTLLEICFLLTIFNGKYPASSISFNIFCIHVNLEHIRLSLHGWEDIGNMIVFLYFYMRYLSSFLTKIPAFSVIQIILISNYEDTLSQCPILYLLAVFLLWLFQFQCFSSHAFCVCCQRDLFRYRWRTGRKKGNKGSLMASDLIQYLISQAQGSFASQMRSSWPHSRFSLSEGLFNYRRCGSNGMEGGTSGFCTIHIQLDLFVFHLEWMCARVCVCSSLSIGSVTNLSMH